MNWYCVHTKPRREKTLVAYCQEQLGLEAFYPLLRQHRRIRRVMRSVSSPLFPRYAFCRYDPAISYRAVRYAPDALGVVQLGDQPTIVGDDLIEELKLWTGEGAVIESTLQPGDPVEIVEGPMRGLTAVVMRAASDRDRVEILLSLLQNHAQVVISRTQIKRAV